MTVALDGRLVLAGAGKMGGAMLAGWLKQRIEPARLAVIEYSMDWRKRHTCGPIG